MQPRTLTHAAALTEKILGAYTAHMQSATRCLYRTPAIALNCVPFQAHQRVPAAGCCVPSPLLVFVARTLICAETRLCRIFFTPLRCRFLSASRSTRLQASARTRTRKPRITRPCLGPSAWLSAEPSGCSFPLRSCPPLAPLPLRNGRCADGARLRYPVFLAGQQTVALRTSMRSTLQLYEPPQDTPSVSEPCQAPSAVWRVPSAWGVHIATHTT